MQHVLCLDVTELVSVHCLVCAALVVVDLTKGFNPQVNNQNMF